ncbi:MAG: hypothetical protein CME62_07100 [Halobacteriovoraceae bacterium]|nr:hypothetical protein [Halobacteriovoraceae bacterium]|tara:strand:- start:2238 stop:3311 length:1074 start_codon:yes stop_codon:yes gene_type:complete
MIRDTKLWKLKLKSVETVNKKIILLLFFITVSCGAPTLKIKKSDHFDGERFFNPEHKDGKSFLDLMKWKFSSKASEWPDYVTVKQQKPKEQRVSGSQAKVYFINHATTLIQMDGVNILTDPIWSERTSPVSWAGPKRVKQPGIAFEDLPPIDLILISHNHYDHMDIPTLENLIDKYKSKVIVGLGNSYYFSDQYKKFVIELDWQDKYSYQNIEMTFVKVRHWSRRTLFDTNKTLWGGFFISGSKNIYFAGDTGYADHFKEANAQFKHIDLALLPIGAYEPRWFMKSSHMNPEESVRAHNDLNAKQSIGIHFGCFQLTDEGIDSPLTALEVAKQDLNPASSFITLEHGDFIVLKDTEE